MPRLPTVLLVSLLVVLAGCSGADVSGSDGATEPTTSDETTPTDTQQTAADAGDGRATVVATGSSGSQTGVRQPSRRVECVDSEDRLTQTTGGDGFIGPDASGATVGYFEYFQFCHEARYVLSVDRTHENIYTGYTYDIVINVTDASADDFTMHVTYENNTTTYKGNYRDAIDRFLGSDMFMENMRLFDATSTYGITGETYVEVGQYSYQDIGSMRQVHRIGSSVTAVAGVDCINGYTYQIGADEDPMASAIPDDAESRCMAPGHGIPIDVDIGNGATTMVLTSYEEQ